MTAFYNEHDPVAAAWLRELIREGHIAPGVVDERDIQHLREVDLGGFTQVHLFAGIGGWSLALRLAGWPDSRPVWTGSCPCQPFSSAGKQKGAKDARHLWPWMRHLVFRWRPAIAFGEQVASGLGRQWLAGVRANLETLGYVVGAADLCAAGVAAPHIRQRLFWVADARHELQPRPRQGRGVEAAEWSQPGIDVEPDGVDGGLGDADLSRLFPRRQAASIDGHGRAALANGGARRLAHPAMSPGAEHEHDPRERGVAADYPAERLVLGRVGNANFTGSQGRHVEWDGTRERASRTTGVGGFWSAFNLIPCRDGKARRVEPGTFPLVARLPSSLGAVWASCVHEASREVNGYATDSGGHFDEVVRMVRDLYAAEALPREAGGCGGLPPTAFLLDFLLCLSPAFNGAADGGRIPQASPQAAGGVLRGVRGNGRVRRPSRGRRPDEQRGGQPADSVPELSRLLARCTQTLWEAAVREDATSIPLSIWPMGRVGLLRGYGNAICPQAAAAFITAYSGLSLPTAARATPRPPFQTNPGATPPQLIKDGDSWA